MFETIWVVFGVIWEVFWEDVEGKTVQKRTKKLQKTYLFLFKIDLNSLFNERGVPIYVGLLLALRQGARGY